ncbi:MAG: oligosaccharide flippase family protein [Salinivirgaceae bacterium]|nr:oligosaccharide flippase family protein [Salinivirgaceae bacterium]
MWQSLKKQISSVCKKSPVSDKKASFLRLAKPEKCDFTFVNDHFEGKRNEENGVFLRRLRKSENFSSLAGNVLYAAFSLVTFLLMVRLLDKELYGRWVIYITAVSLLDMIRLGLAGTAAIRLISISKGEDRNSVIASSYQISILSSVILSILFLIGYISIKSHFPNGYYTPVLLYYPLLAFANMSFNQANTVSQGLINFKRVLIIRALNGGLNLLFIGGYILIFEVNIHGIIITHIIASAVVSLFSILKQWDGLKYIKLYNLQTIKSILHFGKYSTAGSIGSNLLRSSDTIIMSMSSIMGAQAIAIYAIPLKIVEFVEIPLRSFSATAFPKLSQALKNGKDKFNTHFSQYLAATTFMLIPVVVVLMFLPELFLKLIGGNEYLDSMELQKNIMYIIIAYIFILPLDRYTGVALFAVDKPKINFYKIMFMLIANVIFDCIAVFVFNSLILMALATLLFTILGIGLGWKYINKETGITIKIVFHVIKESLSFVRSKYKK